MSYCTCMHSGALRVSQTCMMGILIVTTSPSNWSVPHSHAVKWLKTPTVYSYEWHWHIKPTASSWNVINRITPHKPWVASCQCFMTVCQVWRISFVNRSGKKGSLICAHWHKWACWCHRRVTFQAFLAMWSQYYDKSCMLVLSFFRLADVACLQSIKQAKIRLISIHVNASVTLANMAMLWHPVMCQGRMFMVLQWQVTQAKATKYSRYQNAVFKNYIEWL